MANGIGSGMPGGLGGLGPQQLSPNPGAGTGPVQGVPHQQHPPHLGHPPLHPPGPQGIPPPNGTGCQGPATTQSMLAQQKPTDGSPREAERSREGSENES